MLETETSNQDGTPIRLYEFRRGSQIWRYNSSDRTVIRNGWTFLGGVGYPTKDDGVRQSSDPTQDSFLVTLSSRTDIALLYSQYMPSTPVWLRAYDAFGFGYEAYDDEITVSFVGPITDVRRPAPGTVILVCQNITQTLSRPGLRLGYERGCPYSLYDTDCRVPRESQREDVTIERIDGTSIILGSTAHETYGETGWYDGGYVEWRVHTDPYGDDHVYEQRGILHQDGHRLYLVGGCIGIAQGPIRIYPGCARTSAVCQNKFNNFINYGGFPLLPGKSPFDGSPVF